MKLLWHEFKTEALRWRWLLILWWLIVLVDLGYQLDWWMLTDIANDVSDTDPDAALQDLRPVRSNIHDFFAGIVRSIVWLSLIVAPLVMFAAISPTRTRSSLRTRPVSLRNRIAGRTSWLMILVALPWLLHELYYVAAVADVGIAFTIRALIERLLWTVVLFFAGGILGWTCGNFWRGLLTVGIGLGAIIIGTISHQYLPVADPGDLTRIHGVDHLLAWSLFTIILSVTGALWIGYQWQRRSNRSSWWKKWLPFIAVCLFQTPLYFFVFEAVENWAIASASQHRKQNFDPDFQPPTTWQPTIEIASSKATILPIDGTAYWSLSMEFDELSKNFSPSISGAHAEWKSDDGAELRSFHFGGGASINFEPHPTPRELQNAQQQFPDTTIYANAFLPPVLDTPTAYLNQTSQPTDKPDLLPLLPPGHQFTGEAKIDFDLWRMHNWSELPLDGSKADLGSLRQVHFAGTSVYTFSSTPVAEQPNAGSAPTEASIKIPETSSFRNSWGVVLFVRFHEPRSFTDTRSAIPFRRIFGIWDKKRDRLILIPHDDDATTIRGAASAYPLREIRLELRTVDQQHTVAHLHPWDKSARLVMLESSHAGSTSKTLRQENLSIAPNGGGQIFRTTLLQDRTPTPNPPTPPVPSWQDPNSSEEEIRAEVYELLESREPINGRISEIADTHRPLLREIALRTPSLLHRFMNAWNDDSDRDWFLEHLESSASLPTAIVQVAAWRGWLEQRKDWLLEQITHRPGDLPPAAVDIAARLGMAGAREERYRRALANTGPIADPIDDADHAEFEKVRQQATADLQRRWEKVRWQTGIFGGVPFEGILLAQLGDPAPLREMLTAYIKEADALSASSTTSHIIDRWPHMALCFADEESVGAVSAEARVEKAKHWLASEWIYDPATRTFRSTTPSAGPNAQ